MSRLLAATAMVGATIVNLDGGPHRTNAVVVIEGERIREIADAAPAGADIRHADGLFLLPGLVNLHVHLGLVLPGKMAAELASESDAARALRMAANAGRSLEAGVTTNRIPGDSRTRIHLRTGDEPSGIDRTEDLATLVLGLAGRADLHQGDRFLVTEKQGRRYQFGPAGSTV